MKNEFLNHRSYLKFIFIFFILKIGGMYSWFLWAIEQKNHNQNKNQFAWKLLWGKENLIINNDVDLGRLNQILESFYGQTSTKGGVFFSFINEESAKQKMGDVQYFDVAIAPQSEFKMQSNILVLYQGELLIRQGGFQVNFDWGEGCYFSEDQKLVLFKDQEGIWIYLLEGSLDFPCFNFDHKIVLKSGQVVEFKWELNKEGKPKLDWLPSGKKLVRGTFQVINSYQEFLTQNKKRLFHPKFSVLTTTNLKDKTMNSFLKIPASGFTLYWPTWVEWVLKKENHKENLLKKKIDEKNKKKICQKPRAEFGQCMMRKNKENRCYYYRCSAQGTWEYGIQINHHVSCSTEGKIIPCPD